MLISTDRLITHASHVRPPARPPGGPSFLRSFLPSVLPSFGPSFIRSFFHSVLPSFGPSFLRSFLPSVLPSFGPSFLRSFLHSVLPSFGPSFIRSVRPSSLHGAPRRSRSELDSRPDDGREFDSRPIRKTLPLIARVFSDGTLKPQVPFPSCLTVSAGEIKQQAANYNRSCTSLT